MRLNNQTPLGEAKDYFDRTEAQKRQALHARILWWAKRRKLPTGYVRMPSVPAPTDAEAEGETTEAQAPGTARSRPRPAPEDRKEDHPYYFAEVARVNAELVRPLLPGPGQPERAQNILLWAFLLRTIQTRT